MPGPLGLLYAARRARRLYPLAMMAYERWQRLSPEEKERYRQRARDAVERGRRFAEDRATSRRGGRGGRH